MANDDFLKINPRKVIRCLKGIVSEAELNKIEEELKKHIKKLVRLGEAHLRYANNLNGAGSWRQRVSRAYYACYSLSKAIRLAEDGIYSTDSSDHKKIGSLPNDFDDKPTWENKLTQFRADRNIADYDHSATEKELEVTSGTYLSDATLFTKKAKEYLKGKSYI